MAALDFPSSPTTGQTFFSNGYGWQYNGTTWVPLGAGSSFASFTAGTLDGGNSTSTTTSVTSPTVETGITPVWYGGTGLSNVPAAQVLVGTGTSALTTSPLPQVPSITLNNSPSGWSQISSYSLI